MGIESALGEGEWGGSALGEGECVCGGGGPCRGILPDEGSGAGGGVVVAFGLRSEGCAKAA